jgi:hypothetical protein
MRETSMREIDLVFPVKQKAIKEIDHGMLLMGGQPGKVSIASSLRRLHVNIHGRLTSVSPITPALQPLSVSITFMSLQASANCPVVCHFCKCSSTGLLPFGNCKYENRRYGDNDWPSQNERVSEEGKKVQ